MICIVGSVNNIGVIKIVIKTYFHVSTTAREWRRENMGFVVFLDIFSKFLSELVSLYSVQPPVSSMIKVKKRLDRSLKTLKFFISTISDDT